MDIITEYLYKTAIEDDKKILQKYSEADRALLSEMLYNFDPGANYEVLVQLVYLKKITKDQGNLLLDYAPRFSDNGIKATIVQIIGQCRLYKRANDILNIFFELSEKEKYAWCPFFDNALKLISNEKNDIIFFEKLASFDLVWYFSLTFEKLMKKYPDRTKELVREYPRHYKDGLDFLIINAMFRFGDPEFLEIVRDYAVNGKSERVKFSACEKLKKWKRD
jgi:hypothetical protein